MEIISFETGFQKTLSSPNLPTSVLGHSNLKNDTVTAIKLSIKSTFHGN